MKNQYFFVILNIPYLEFFHWPHEVRPIGYRSYLFQVESYYKGPTWLRVGPENETFRN